MAQTSIKKNFAYKSALNLSSYVIGFITFPYISRLMGAERVGLVNFVDNTVSYFLLFATLGIGLLGVREIARVRCDERERSRVFANLLGVNLLFTLLTLVVFVAAICLVPTLRQYSDLFWVGSAKIIFSALLVEWFFSGMENFRYITLRTVAVKLLYVVAVFLFVRRADQYPLYFILTVGVVVVNALINMLYARRFVRLRLSELFSLRYLRSNCTLGVYSIMTSMYLTFNVMFLGFVAGNTEVGYYTTAFKLYTVFLGFFSAFANVMLPVTTLSAAKSTTAEPVAPRCGTHTTFITTLNVAPMMDAARSTPSRLSGINIWMAKICAKPTASNAGITICIGTTAPAKPSPAMT